MKILIIDIDSKIKNYALAKVEKYHLDKGDEVTWNMPLARHIVDKVYVSCVFEKNKNLCFDYMDDPKCLIGGSGYSLSIKLPDEIEQVKPKINLGFTTRGCIRNCEFCIVPQKEGKIKIVGDLSDLWDGKSKDVVLLDNNILSVPNHFRAVCKQARENNIRLDFNQGLDHRLLTDKVCEEIKKTKMSDLRFAYDDISEFETVKKALDLLDKYSLKHTFWYVLIGFDTTLEEDLQRVNYLKSRNQRVFAMRYNFNRSDRQLMMFSRWVNKQDWFQKTTWEEFLKRNYGIGDI